MRSAGVTLPSLLVLHASVEEAADGVMPAVGVVGSPPGTCPGMAPTRGLCHAILGTWEAGLQRSLTVVSEVRDEEPMLVEDAHVEMSSRSCGKSSTSSQSGEGAKRSPETALLRTSSTGRSAE